MAEITGTAAALTDLGRPPADWTALARGYGVPALAVADGGALARALAVAAREPGPFLVEMRLA